MKLISILLTISVIVGLIAGIALVVFREIAFAGVVWSITLILSCIARRVALHREKKEKKEKNT